MRQVTKECKIRLRKMAAVWLMVMLSVTSVPGAAFGGETHIRNENEVGDKEALQEGNETRDTEVLRAGNESPDTEVPQEENETRAAEEPGEEHILKGTDTGYSVPTYVHKFTLSSGGCAYVDGGGECRLKDLLYCRFIRKEISNNILYSGLYSDDEISDIKISENSPFRVSKNSDGEWIIRAERKFSKNASYPMSITVNGKYYSFTVECDSQDDGIIKQGSFDNGISYTVDGAHNVFFSGTGDLYFSNLGAGIINYAVIGEGITGLGSKEIKAPMFSSEMNPAGCCAQHIIFPKSLEYIGQYACHADKYLQSITFPEKMDKELILYENALDACPLLRSVELPEGVISIGKGGVSCCFYLESITLPQSLKSIGYAAFSHCYHLKKLVLPEKLEFLGDSIVMGDEELESVRLPSEIDTVGGQLKYGGPSPFFPDRVFSPRLTIFIVPEGGMVVRNVADEAFMNCDFLEGGDIRLSGNGISVGKGAFYGMKNTVRIDPGTTFGDVSEKAFYGCTALKGAVRLSVSAEKIGKEAFKGCTGISELDLSEAEKRVTIEDEAFSGCTGIKKITAPKKYLDRVGLVIKDRVFSGCTGLERLYLYDVPEGVTIGDSAFEGCNKLGGDIPLSYKTDIGSYAFAGCKNLKSISLIPPRKLDVTVPSEPPYLNLYIHNHAFDGCTGLESVELYNTMYIGDQAFNGCTGIRSLKLPDIMRTMPPFIPETHIYAGVSVFEGCTGIKDVELPCFYRPTTNRPSVHPVPASFFKGCTGLESVRVSSGTKTISSDVFSGCSSLKSIILPAELEEIGNDAFSGCSSLTDVYFGGTEEQWNSVNKNNNTLLDGLSFHHTDYLPLGSVIIKDSAHGSVSCEHIGVVANIKKPEHLITTPDPGYETDHIRITDKNGNELVPYLPGGYAGDPKYDYVPDNHYFFNACQYATVEAFFRPSFGSSGQGTAEDPVLISSAEEWNAMAASIEKGTDIAGLDISLTSDISISTMMGSVSRPFAGNFNGNGHTIQVDISGDEGFEAPFRCVQDSVIEDLTVTGSVNGGAFSSGLVGKISDNSSCRVSGCAVKALLNGTVDPSVFIGKCGDGVNAEIKDCLDLCGEDLSFALTDGSGTVSITNSYYYGGERTSEENGVKRSFRISGMSPVTIALKGSTGVAFAGDLYAGNGEIIGLLLQSPPYYLYEASAGKLEENGDDWILTVAGEDTVISAYLPMEEKPEAVFEASGYDSGTLSGLVPSAHYSVSGAAVTDLLAEGSEAELTGVSAGTLYIKRIGNNISSVDSPEQMIEITRAEMPDNVDKKDCTTEEDNDGILTGTDAAMEYRRSDDLSWIRAEDVETTGLKSGIYYVRLAASGTTLASDSIMVDILAFTPPNQVTAPVFSPAGGTYDAALSVTVSCSSPGADIYYTEDGSIPDRGSIKYTEPITVSMSKTIRAFAVIEGMKDSTVADAAYIIREKGSGDDPGTPDDSENQVTAPVFSPAGGTYDAALSVTVSCSSPGADIYYTEDGSIPDRGSIKYTEPITVSMSKTIRAFAVIEGMKDSTVADAVYIIREKGSGDDPGTPDDPGNNDGPDPNDNPGNNDGPDPNDNPGLNEDPSGDPSTLQTEYNIPKEYKEEERDNFRLSYYHNIAFFGNGKADIGIFGERGITVSCDEGTFRVTKVKINKKKHLVCVTGLENADSALIKKLKKATKGKRGLPYSLYPHHVMETDEVKMKKKKNGSISSVKILLGGKFYKAKKDEWSYDPEKNLLEFKGNNLEGSRQGF